MMLELINQRKEKRNLDAMKKQGIKTYLRRIQIRAAAWLDEMKLWWIEKGNKMATSKP